MRSEILLEMSPEEVDAYAKLLGVNTTGLKTVRAKVNLIEKRRAKEAEIDVFGLTIRIPIKRAHDKRYVDMYVKGTKDGLTDEEAMEMLLSLIGEDQYQALVDRCTEEDGTIDNDAVTLGVAMIVGADELKNF